MKAVVHRLSKLSLRTIKVNYSPTNTSWVLNHIATTPAHPLYIAQRRRVQEKQKKEGLRWEATSGVDLAKSACVRTWARRRLRQALVEELRAKGYDETGKLVDQSPMQERPDVANVLRMGRSVDLTGSLRMHAMPPLIPAKFATVKDDVRGIVDALVQSALDTALGFSGEGQKSSVPGSKTLRAASSSQSRQPPVTPKKKPPVTLKKKPALQQSRRG